MKKLLAAIAVTMLGTTVANAQSCRSASDAGNAKCLAGVLYRCACSTIVGATVCTWDNAAAECSAITEGGASSGPTYALGGAADGGASAKEPDRRYPSDQ